MFIRINKQKNKDGSIRQYLQLCQTFRVDQKVRQQTLLTLGRLEDLQQGSLDTLIEGLAKFSERYAQRIHGQGASSVAVLWTKEFGPVYLFRKIWEQLGMGRFLRKLLDDVEVAVQYEEAIFAMVLNRLMDPFSKYRIFRQWVQTVYAQGLDEIQLHHYYRALDFLAEYKDLIEQQLYGRLTDLTTLDLDLVFYDTTSTYFEGDETDELAQYGYSKDHRGDRKQVVIGLLMTKQGIPIAHQVFPGNLHDTKTFGRVIEDLKKRFSVRKVILVGDRGMVSETNLEQIRTLGMEYVVGVKLRKSQQAQELLSIRGRYKKIRKNLEIKSKEINGETYVLCYNPDAAVRDETSRKVILEKLQSKLDQLGPSGLVKNRAYSKYLTIDKASARIDETKVEEDAKFDGKYAIRTNSSLTPDEAALVYKELWRVEQAFRNLKDNLELRPMYHRRESRIRGHIMVCFLALVMESYLALRLKETGCTMSVKDVLHDVSQMKASLIRVEGQEQIIRTELHGEANAAFVAIGTQAPPRVLTNTLQ
ncbi:IS1634 family transposase [Effusibacillus lacus]|uniref:Transposase n=1 Tax=Effusibacillus lacus TaxID=1348429 RepID=A0A292YHW0_9BACL|nr:IS4 family transposase [Effusibacillus lacus]GAX88401.1 transposase [Effusibacillus lacus]